MKEKVRKLIALAVDTESYDYGDIMDIFADEAFFLMEECAKDVYGFYEAMLSVFYHEEENMASFFEGMEGDATRLVEAMTDDAFCGFFDGLIHAFCRLPYDEARCDAIAKITRQHDEYFACRALENLFESSEAVDFGKKVWHLMDYIPYREYDFKERVTTQALNDIIDHVKTIGLDDKEAELCLNMARYIVSEMEFNLMSSSNFSDIVWRRDGNIAEHWRFLRKLYQKDILSSSCESFYDFARDIMREFDLDPITAAPRLRRLVCQTLGGDKRRMLCAPDDFGDFASPVVMDQGENNLMVMDEGEIFIIRADDKRISVEPL